MNVSVGSYWEEFVGKLVATGRYGSASEIMREGLRLVEQREVQLQELRDSIERSTTDDVWYSADEVVDYVNAALQEDADAPDAPK